MRYCLATRSPGPINVFAYYDPNHCFNLESRVSSGDCQFEFRLMTPRDVPPYSKRLFIPAPLLKKKPSSCPYMRNIAFDITITTEFVIVIHIRESILQAPRYTLWNQNSPPLHMATDIFLSSLGWKNSGPASRGVLG